MLNEKIIDILDRQLFVDDVKGVIRLLSEDKKNVTFAINGQWGVGKTFVLNMLEEQLQDEYLVLHYNAWEYDYYDEPLIALLTAIISQLDQKYAYEKVVNIIAKDVLKKVIDSLLDIVGEISKNKLGVNLVEKIGNFIKRIKKQDEERKSFDKNRDITQIINEVKKQLCVLSKETTVVVVVDELDRCLPEYAIKVLERLHHVLTGVENLQVILSVDKKQLDNTVTKIFGNDKNIDGYLRKFIHFSMDLPIGRINTEKWGEKFAEYKSMFKKTWYLTDLNDINNFIDSIYLIHEMRTFNHIIEKAYQLHNTLMGKTNMWDPAYMCLELLLIVAQKEEMFDWEKVPHIQSILNVFDRGNKKLEFMYNIIIEPHSSIDSEKKHYSIRNNGTIWINMIDIWSLLWVALGSLFPNNLLRDVRCINSAFGDTNVDYINGFIEYAKKFQKLCAFIQ